jgi:hypothetical protein
MQKHVVPMLEGVVDEVRGRARGRARARARARGRGRVRVPMLEGVVDAAPPHAEECARL